MKVNLDKLLSISLIVSILSIIIGYVLWDILIPIQDYNLSTDEQLLEAQKEAAINYPLGRFLLYLGFFGLTITAIGYIRMYVQAKRQK